MGNANAWYHNPTIWAGFFAWLLAQILKLVATTYRTRRFDFGFLFRLGGMPSSHSALACAVAASVGLSEGFASPVFAAAAALAAIVMIDAASVRRAAGLQARLLNQIIAELFEEHRFSQQKLVELLGHTRLEVLLGMALGVVVALLVHSFIP